MVVALLCATLILEYQDPPRATIEQRALRADVALPKIGARFGMRLVPDESTKNDVLLTYLPDVTFEEFRAKTAKGWNATWEFKDDVWTLSRTAEQEQAEVAAFIERRGDELLRQMVSWQNRAELTDADAERLADYLSNLGDRRMSVKSLITLEGYAFRSDTLGRRALRRFLVALGPNYLAELYEGQDRVFESGDGDHHHPALDEMLLMYGRENAKIRSELARFGRLEELETEVTDYGTAYPLRNGLHVTRGVSKFVVKVAGDNIAFFPKLFAFDEDGLLLFSVDDMVFSVGRLQSSLPLAEPLELTISDKAASIIEFFLHRSATFASQDDVAKRMPFRGSLFLDVLKAMPSDDELKHEPSEVLLALAKSLDLGLVARLGDELLRGNPISRARGGWENVNLTERTLEITPWRFARFHTVIRDDKIHVLIVTPKTPATLKSIYPRDAIAEFCRRADSPSGAGVDDLGRLIASVLDYSSLMDLEFLGELVPVVEWTFDDFSFSQYRYVMLYCLKGTQRQIASMPGGLTVKLSQLPAVIRDLVDTVLFFVDFTYGLMDYDYLEASGIQREASLRTLVPLALPNGVPADATANIKLVEMPYIYIEDPDEPRRCLDLDSVASYYRRLDDATEKQRREWLETVPFYVGTIVEVKLQVDLGVALYQDFGDAVTSLGDGRAYRFEQLPQEVQKEFWELVNEGFEQSVLHAGRS